LNLIGDYWHSEKYKPSEYHLKKTIECEKNGYKLIHIFEYEWLNKQEIIKNKLNFYLNSYKECVYARKCIIKEIDSKTKNEFLNQHHIQGEDKSKVKLGLFYKDELVAVMTFGKPRFNKNYEWELIRYATSKHVLGGAGKLLKYFERNYNPKSIITYADRRFSQGNMYYKLGFKLDHISNPNFIWIDKKHNIKSRMNSQKFKIITDENKNLTAEQIMIKAGYNKIYDCGNLVFTKSYHDTP
jgi:hypothetical protein